MRCSCGKCSGNLWQTGHKKGETETVMAENRSTESKGTAPALSELLMQTEWADEDDVAAFCYRYIYENLLDFLRANWKDESRIGVEYGTTQAEIDKKHSMVFIGNIYDSANKFGAEVREKMAEFILDHGLKEEEINWPVQWIQIDTIRRSEIKNAIDQNIDDYYKDRFYIDLLNTKYPNPDRPTPTEQAVAARRSQIGWLTPEKKHPIRRALGWIVTFLLGCNTAAAVLAQFFGTDLQKWLQEVCYKGLVRMNARAAADIIDSCIENLLLSGNFILLFGRGSVGSWITFAVTAGLFLLFLLRMIASGRKHRRLEAERQEKIRKLNEEINTILASPEYSAETEHRRAVREYYPKMMAAFYAARRAEYRQGVIRTEI